MSLRTSPQAGVAIPIMFLKCLGDSHASVSEIKV